LPTQVQNAMTYTNYVIQNNKEIVSKFNNIKVISTTPIKSDIEEEIPEEVIEDSFVP